MPINLQPLINKCITAHTSTHLNINIMYFNLISVYFFSLIHFDVCCRNRKQLVQLKNQTFTSNTSSITV